MSRLVAERKTLGTARYFHRVGAAHLPRACATGTRASGSRGDETPQQAPQGAYIHSLAIQGGAPQNGNGGIRQWAPQGVSPEIPLTERRAPWLRNSGIY
jgi:hypothetical protein